MRKKHIPLFVFVALFITAFFGSNHILELRAEEPRRAIVALEMLFSGNWLTPTIHGYPYYNKPPVFNWILAVFYGITGNYSEWMTRLPSSLFLLLTAFVNYRVTQRELGKSVAFLGSAFYLFCGEILFYALNAAGEIDLTYAFLVYTQMASLYYFYKQKQQGIAYVLFFALGAIGFLTKGIPSLAFTALSLLAWMLFLPSLKELLKLRVWLGVLVFVGIVGLYLWAYSTQADVVSFLAQQFWEASHKSANESPILTIAVQFIQFPFHLFFLLIPFSFLAFLLIKKDYRHAVWQADWLRWGLLFVVFNIVIYWISPGTRNRYLYPFFPFLANVFALLYARWITHEKSRLMVKRITQSLVVLVTVALLVVINLPTFSVVSFRWTLVLILLPLLIWILDFSTKTKEPILALIMLLLIGNIAQSYLLQTQWQETSNQLIYRDTSTRILALTNNQTPRFYGPERRTRIEMKIGSFVLDTVYIKKPPAIALQVPYYLCKETHQIFQFSDSVESHGYYLGFERDIPKEGIIEITRFEERWRHEDLVLFTSSN